MLNNLPVRSFFLVHVARELDLVFPSSSATAMTIRSMHQAVEGAAMARRKLRAMVIAFSSALLLRVVSQYAIGVFWVCSSTGVALRPFTEDDYRTGMFSRG